MKSALDYNPQKKRGFVNFDQNLCVSRKLIQEKALDLLDLANKKGLIDFKASLT